MYFLQNVHNNMSVINDYQENGNLKENRTSAYTSENGLYQKFRDIQGFSRKRNTHSLLNCMRTDRASGK